MQNNKNITFTIIFFYENENDTTCFVRVNRSMYFLSKKKKTNSVFLQVGQSGSQWPINIKYFFPQFAEIHATFHKFYIRGILTL